jgi:hypothetical protein
VVFSFLDPLLAVVTLSTRHTQILTQSGEIPFSGIAVFQPQSGYSCTGLLPAR